MSVCMCMYVSVYVVSGCKAYWAKQTVCTSDKQMKTFMGIIKVWTGSV